jgi:hypothetical protein
VQKKQENKNAQELNSFTELVVALSMRCDAKRETEKSAKKQMRG